MVSFHTVMTAATIHKRIAVWYFLARPTTLK